MRWISSCSATGVALIAFITAAPADAQLIRTASGANPAAIQATVDQFRGDLGGALNPNTPGSQPAGRREINWDAVPDASAAPNALPANFFNATSPRGVIMSTPGTSFQVSMDDNVPADADPDLVRFSHIVAGYGAAFQTFSAQRLFGAIGSTITDVTFHVPGSLAPATVKGFGVVFTDVDGAATTSIEPFRADGTSLGVYTAPSGAMSFVGVSYFDAYTVSRVRITSGNSAFGAADSPATDVVAMDDFIYGEPQPQAIQFQFTKDTHAETDGVAFNVTLTRSGPTAGGASVDLALSGTAGSGVDFTIGPLTVPFMVGSATATFSITMLNDAFIEGLELGYVTLQNPSAGYVIGPKDRFTLVVVDDELASPTAYASTTTNRLVSFSTTAAGALSSNVPIVGLQPGETLLGVDYRPANGQLYGLGSTSRLYQIAPGPAEATAAEVGTGPFTPALSGTTFGFDVNPMADRIRVVSDTGVSFRLNPDTGAVVQVDTALAYAAADVNAGQAPAVTAVGYTHNVPGWDVTTLFGLDAQTNSLVVINPPNAGQLQTIGPVGIDFIPGGSLDISQGSEIAFALLKSAIDPTTHYLYLVDQTTGEGELMDLVAPATPLTYTGFALIPNGVLRFTNAIGAMVTEGQVAQLFIERVGGSRGTLAATLTPAGGNAVPGVDYVNAFATINFADGEVGPKPIAVTTLDDAAADLGSIALLNLVPQPFGARTRPDSSTVNIVDNDQPLLTINDVAVIEGHGGTTNAVFTVTLSGPAAAVARVNYVTTSGTASANTDYQHQSDLVVFQPGETMQQIVVPIAGDLQVEADETFFVNLSLPVSAAIADAQGVGTITNDDTQQTYYFAEGATGNFFTFDIALANPNAGHESINLRFFKEGGAPPVDVPIDLTPLSRRTIRVNNLPGLGNLAGLSTLVTSPEPIVVDRTMLWDESGYGGHSGRSTQTPSFRWYFAEGVQNASLPQTGSQPFFDTFLLIANPQPAPVTATVRFLLEPSGVVTKTYDLLASSRLTIYAGGIPEIVARSFAVEVSATQPILAERSTYFGAARFWDGGHGSTGVPEPSTTWFLAEGATGPFFETFLALANPNEEPATATVRYLLSSGVEITKVKPIAAGARLTINVEQDDPGLANAAVSTVITSDRPITAERMMYWPDPVTSWHEGHSTFGVTAPGLHWGLAEGRSRGALNYETYVLIGNPNGTAAEVSVRFLADTGAIFDRNYSIAAHSRFNLHVNTDVPELAGRDFSTVVHVTNGQPIVVEGAMYWDTLGIRWLGGSALVATPLVP